MQPCLFLSFLCSQDDDTPGFQACLLTSHCCQMTPAWSHIPSCPSTCSLISLPRSSLLQDVLADLSQWTLPIFLDLKSPRLTTPLFVCLVLTRGTSFRHGCRLSSSVEMSSQGAHGAGLLPVFTLSVIIGLGWLMTPVCLSTAGFMKLGWLLFPSALYLQRLKLARNIMNAC